MRLCQFLHFKSNDSGVYTELRMYNDTQRKGYSFYHVNFHTQRSIIISGEVPWKIAQPFSARHPHGSKQLRSFTEGNNSYFAERFYHSGFYRADKGVKRRADKTQRKQRKKKTANVSWINIKSV